MSPTLYILCGAAGCGKSTFASRFANGDTVWISRDDCRFHYLNEHPDAHYFDFEKESFRDFIKKIATSLMLADNVIADATHLNTASRKKLTKAIDQYFQNYKIIYIVFLASAEECIKHNANRTGRQLVPEDVIRDMRKSLTIPRNEDTRAVGLWRIEGEV